MKSKISLLLGLILTFSLLIRIWQVNRTGSLGDEWDRWRAGIQYVDALKKFDFKGTAWGWNIEHPPVAKYIYGIAGRLTIRFLGNNPNYPHDNNYTLGRIFSALLQTLTVLIVFLIGKELFSARVGLLAAGVLTLIPVFIAYGRLVGLESPLVLFYTSCIYFFLRGLRNNSSRDYFWSSVFLGLSLSTRYDSFLLFVLLPIIYLIFNFRSFRSGSVNVRSYLFFFPAISGLIFILVWPYLWPSPFKNFMASLNHWQSSGGGVTRLYYLNYFLATTPVLLFIPFIFSLSRLLLRKEIYVFVIFLWFLTPFLLSFGDLAQGGLRYVFPIFPPFSLLCALGLDWFVRKKILFGLVSAGLVVYLSYTDFIVHPYYLDYFNEAIGGTKNAVARGYDYGYWSEGIAEAVSYVNKTLPKNSSLELAITAYHALPPIRNDIKQWPRIIGRNQLASVKPEEVGVNYLLEKFPKGVKADYLLVHEMSLNDLGRYYHPVYSLNVMDAPLYTLYKLN